ncbi:MAG: hypothetical protein AB1540_10620 [Bdellovibrionota bacterium]
MATKQRSSMSESGPDKLAGGRRLLVFYLLLLAFALAVALVFQSWLANRLTIWGDESDTMAPAFRVWKGDKDFLWQIGQYNANPPGDNLVLRLYYRSGILHWLKETSESLYWRLPYILVFAFSIIASFVGVFRWTRSGLLSLFAALCLLCSPMVFTYATEVRFYIWLTFFLTLATYLILPLFEEAFKDSEKVRPSFAVLSLVVALGICFHMMLVPVGYIVLVYALVCLGIKARRDLKKGRFTKNVRPFEYFALLILGFLPFTIYKVQVKHWIFVPSPWHQIDPLERLLAAPLSLFVSRISESLPFPWFWLNGGLVGLWALLALGAIAHLYARRWSRALQFLYLFAMIVGTPFVLFYEAAARNFPFNYSHAVYQATLVTAALILVLIVVAEAFRSINIKSLYGAPTKPLCVLIGAGLFIVALERVSHRALTMKHSSPAKENYSFNEWREYYRRVPDRSALFVIGANAQTMAADAGGYVAGQVERYTKEFSPYYISKQGNFDPLGRKIDIDLKKLRFPRNADFLLIECRKLKEHFPELPWERFSCLTYPDQRLCHCRVRPSAD